MAVLENLLGWGPVASVGAELEALAVQRTHPCLPLKGLRGEK